MSGEHCLDLVRLLQRSFGKEYSPEALNEVWPRLLACEAKALGMAVAQYRRHEKTLPSLERLVRLTEQKQAWLQQQREEQAAAVPMPVEVKGKLTKILGSF